MARRRLVDARVYEALRMGRRPAGRAALHWLGQVGVGRRWWGWALIVLAVWCLLSAAR